MQDRVKVGVKQNTKTEVPSEDDLNKLQKYRTWQSIINDSSLSDVDAAKLLMLRLSSQKQYGVSEEVLEFLVTQGYYQKLIAGEVCDLTPKDVKFIELVNFYENVKSESLRDYLEHYKEIAKTPEMREFIAMQARREATLSPENIKSFLATSEILNFHIGKLDNSPRNIVSILAVLDSPESPFRQTSGSLALKDSEKINLNDLSNSSILEINKILKERGLIPQERYIAQDSLTRFKAIIESSNNTVWQDGITPIQGVVGRLGSTQELQNSESQNLTSEAMLTESLMALWNRYKQSPEMFSEEDKKKTASAIIREIYDSKKSTNAFLGLQIKSSEDMRVFKRFVAEAAVSFSAASNKDEIKDIALAIYSNKSDIKPSNQKENVVEVDQNNSQSIKGLEDKTKLLAYSVGLEVGHKQNRSVLGNLFSIIKDGLKAIINKSKLLNNTKFQELKNSGLAAEILSSAEINTSKSR